MAHASVLYEQHMQENEYMHKTTQDWHPETYRQQAPSTHIQYQDSFIRHVAVVQPALTAYLQSHSLSPPSLDEIIT